MWAEQKVFGKLNGLKLAPYQQATVDRGVFAIGAGGAEDPPRKNASYLGGKELEPLFAHCTYHYSFPLQKIIQNFHKVRSGHILKWNGGMIFVFGGMIFVQPP